MTRPVLAIASSAPADVLGPYIDGGRPKKAADWKPKASTLATTPVDLARYGFDRFVSDRPLERLRRLQEAMAAEVVLRAAASRCRALVGGVDVSYPGRGRRRRRLRPGRGRHGRVALVATVRRAVRFPLHHVLSDLSRVADLAGLAGRGPRGRPHGPRPFGRRQRILHPRHSGVAAHLGVVAGLPTIGVTKKLLCGQVDWTAWSPANRGRWSTRTG